MISNNNLINSLLIELLKRIFTGAIFSFLIFLLLWLYPKLFSIFILFILFLLLKFEWFRNFKFNNLNKLLYYFFTFFYIVMPFIILIYMELNGYIFVNFYLFFLVFSFDSFAYIFGKLLGKIKLCPQISPGKTLEGLVFGILSLFILSILFFNSENILYLLFLNFIIALLAFMGDLFESYLKRLSNIKDSGNLLPGHGGLLDRFDSLIFNIYFLFFLKKYVKLISFKYF